MGEKLKRRRLCSHSLQLAIACRERKRKLQKVANITNAIRSLGFSIYDFEGMGIRIHMNFTFDTCSCGKVQQNLVDNLNRI